jgi:hypothetical protein
MTGTAAWAALEVLFVRRLGERIMMLHASLARLEAEETDAYAFLAWQFHSLAGIGGTFGHHGLTDIALDGEEACHAGAPPNRIAHFVAMVAQFGSALQNRQTTDCPPAPPVFISPIASLAEFARN